MHKQNRRSVKRKEKTTDHKGKKKESEKIVKTLPED